MSKLVEELYETLATGCGVYMEASRLSEILAHIERPESAVRAVKDWDIENFKERGAFVVPQQIRQMIQAATHGEGE